MTQKKEIYVKSPEDLIIEAEGLVSFLQEAIAAILDHTLVLSTNLHNKTPLGIHLVFESAKERLEKAYDLLEHKGAAV